MIVIVIVIVVRMIERATASTRTQNRLPFPQPRFHSPCATTSSVTPQRRPIASAHLAWPFALPCHHCQSLALTQPGVGKPDGVQTCSAPASH